MRVWIDQDCCTGAGLCVDHCPELFVVLEDGIGYVHLSGVVLGEGIKSSVAVPPRYERAAVDAAERCPGECVYLDADRPSPIDTTDDDIIDAEIVSDPQDAG
jgi:ferredoxin